MIQKIWKGALVLALLVIVALPAIAGQADQKELDIPTGWLIGGLVINAGALSALGKNFRTIFNEALSAYQPRWKNGAMEIPSTTSVNTYAWMEAFPKMREWIGDRVVKNLSTQAYDVKNKDFESTVGVKRSAIEDDQYGVYSPVFKSQAIAAASLWDDLFFALLNKGFTDKSYDGLAFFATTHKSGSNKLSGGGSVLSSTSFGDAVKALRTQKDAAGEPLFSGNEKLTLWVPPALEQTARLLLNADFISVTSGSTQNNIWKNAANLEISAKITTATNWFLTVEFMGLQPFLVQVRKLPEFVAMVNPDDPIVFSRNEFQYGTHARGNAGYALHQLAVGSVGA